MPGDGRGNPGGVSTGLIYRHFPSKAELFVEVLNAAVARSRSWSGSPVARRRPERLRLAITAFVRRALAGPGLAHAFIVEPVDPDVEAERMRGRRAFGDVFLRLVEEGVSAGELPAQDAHVAAACLVGAFTEAMVTATKTRDICSFCLRAIGAPAIR